MLKTRRILRSAPARAIAVGLAIMLVAALAAWWPPLDRALSDVRIQLRNQPASGDLAFIAMDSRSLEEIGVWPWPRNLHGQIIETALDAGARDVFMDIDFSAISSEAEDARFEAALERSGGYAYLAAFGHHDSNGTFRGTLPLSRFTDHVDTFAVNVIVDRAGMVRQVPAAVEIGGDVVRSLAATLYPGTAIPATVDIDYGISAETVPTVSVIDVLEGKVPPEFFARRSVVVGASALELQDVFFTPGQGAVPGALIQVLAAESVAQNRVLSATGPVPGLAVLALFLAAMLALGDRARLDAALGAALGVMLAVEAVAHVSYQLWAVMLQTAPLHVGLAIFMIWRILSEARIRHFLIAHLTGERNQMRDILKRVVDDNFDGVVVIDGAQKILAASGPAKTWLGADLVGMAAADILPRPIMNDLRKVFGETPKALDHSSIARERDIELHDGVFTIEYVITVSHVKSGTDTRAFVTLTFRDVTARRKHETELRYLAEHDPLTGALARMSFVAALNQKIRARKPDTQVGVLVLDLRRFKSVNATLGHQFGDVMLQQVVNRLGAAGHRTIARIGGDRFAVALSGKGAEQNADRVFREIAGLLTAPFNISGHHAIIGVSGGGAFSADPDMSGEILLRRADMALGVASARHGSQVAIFEPSMDWDISASRALEQDLRKALEEGQFCMHYQPQLCLADGKPVGAEALLRWHHPEKGLVPPNDFIPVAEETGLIAEIGRFALHAACAQAMAWPSDIRVAVNVSPLQFELSDLLSDVRAALRSSRLPAERLEIEITEGVLLTHKQRAIETLEALSAMGVKIAIDDFGTGFSSLAYLAKLPFDVLKIDKSFVDDMLQSPSAHSVVETIVALGKKLDKTVLAEGIETADQARHLARAGCDVGQGYLYSRPIPDTEIDDVVAHLADEDGLAPAPPRLRKNIA